MQYRALSAGSRFFFPKTALPALFSFLLLLFPLWRRKSLQSEGGEMEEEAFAFFLDSLLCTHNVKVLLYWRPCLAVCIPIPNRLFHRWIGSRLHSAKVSASFHRSKYAIPSRANALEWYRKLERPVACSILLGFLEELREMDPARRIGKY